MVTQRESPHQSWLFMERVRLVRLLSRVLLNKHQAGRHSSMQTLLLDQLTAATVQRRCQQHHIHPCVSAPMDRMCSDPQG